VSGVRRRAALACMACVVGLAGATGFPESALAQRLTVPRPEPVLIHLQEETVPSQHAVDPLSPEQLAQLREARRLREAGSLPAARAALEPLAAELAHHPLVLVERARIHLANNEPAAVERLARFERAAQKDSVLLAREYAIALERLGRGRDAAQVAIEDWAAEPREGSWAGATVIRLLATNPGGIRDLLRRAAQRLPDRIDLLQGLARVEWRLGDVRAAVRAVSEADQPGAQPYLRWSLADEMVQAGSGRDSMAAAEMLLDLAADTRHESVVRLTAARRAWEIFERRHDEADGAARLTRSLADLHGTDWPSELLIAVARGLQAGGRRDEARALLDSRTVGDHTEVNIVLERALADLRDGPAGAALPALHEIAATSPEASFRYAEALFFAGETDSALAWYKRSSATPESPNAGAALERAFLIEEARPPASAVAFGEIAYARWRGDTKEALAHADSLFRSLDRGPTWAQAALLLSDLREASGDHQLALEPVLALVEALPDDRLAPIARHRAGDLYLALGDDAKAVEQYEECLARYPRAWNAPEVRRKLDMMRRERRF